MVEYVGPRDSVLDGQSVSGVTDQKSTFLTNVNKEVNTQTLSTFGEKGGGVDFLG